MVIEGVECLTSKSRPLQMVFNFEFFQIRRSQPCSASAVFPASCQKKEAGAPFHGVLNLKEIHISEISLGAFCVGPPRTGVSLYLIVNKIYCQLWN